MRDNWPCPSRQRMRKLEASKKSFKMLTYGTRIIWRNILSDGASIVEKVLEVHDQEGALITLFYIVGEESIHNTIVKYHGIFK